MDFKRPTLSGSNGLLWLALQEWLVMACIWAVMVFLAKTPLLFAAFYGFAFIALAGRFHALGVILHDGIHSSEIHKKNSLWLSILAAYPIATTPQAMRFHHLRHHRMYGTKNDPYLKSGTRWGVWFNTTAKGLILVFAWSLRPLIALLILALRWMNFRQFAQGVLRIYGRGFLQAKEVDVATELEIEECLLAERKQAVFLFGLLVLTFWQSEWMFTAYWFPLWAAGFVNVWRVYLEHDHGFRRSGEFADDEVGETGTGRKFVWQATRSLAIHPWVRPLNWFLAPRNIGFHQAHHLSPTTRLQDLPALHRELEKQFGESVAATQATSPMWFDDRVIGDAVPSVPVPENSN